MDTVLHIAMNPVALQTIIIGGTGLVCALVLAVAARPGGARRRPEAAWTGGPAWLALWRLGLQSSYRGALHRARELVVACGETRRPRLDPRMQSLDKE